jgi:TPR repeat protein
MLGNVLKKEVKKEAKAQLEKCKIEDALEKGTPAKQYKIAKCLLEGSGFFGQKNRSIAVKLFRKAADNGHVEAAYKTYIQSFFKNRKETYGLKYLHFAAEKGHVEAQLELARCYMNKKNIECKGLYDPNKGFEILKDLVKKTKDPSAYILIARSYETGKGTEKDLEKAKKYYTKVNTEKNYFSTTKAIHRVDLLMNEPDAKTLEEIAKNNPNIYKLKNGKLVAIL